MDAMPRSVTPAPAKAGTAQPSPHAATFSKATCKEWVDALCFRYGSKAVLQAVNGLASDLDLANKVGALVGHFGGRRVRSCLAQAAGAA